MGEAIRAGEAQPLDLREFVADVDQIRGAYGFLLMRLAVTDSPDDTFAVCKKEEAANREAFARLEKLLSRPGLSNHRSWDALVERLRAASDAPDTRPATAEQAERWPGLMAGFAPAPTDRTTTNSGDTGGPI